MYDQDSIEVMERRIRNMASDNDQLRKRIAGLEDEIRQLRNQVVKLECENDLLKKRLKAGGVETLAETVQMRLA